MSDRDRVDGAETEFVTVTTVNGPIEEGQIRSFLEAHGIPVKTRGEALRWTHGITVDGLGAVAIEVPAQHAEEARELIARAEGGELQLPEGFSEEADEGGEAG